MLKDFTFILNNIYVHIFWTMGQFFLRYNFLLHLCFFERDLCVTSMMDNFNLCGIFDLNVIKRFHLSIFIFIKEFFIFRNNTKNTLLVCIYVYGSENIRAVLNKCGHFSKENHNCYSFGTLTFFVFTRAYFYHFL